MFNPVWHCKMQGKVYSSPWHSCVYSVYDCIKKSKFWIEPNCTNFRKRLIFTNSSLCAKSHFSGDIFLCPSIGGSKWNVKIFKFTNVQIQIGWQIWFDGSVAYFSDSPPPPPLLFLIQNSSSFFFRNVADFFLIWDSCFFIFLCYLF